jgi:subtilisin family serine protease
VREFAGKRQARMFSDKLDAISGYNLVIPIRMAYRMRYVLTIIVLLMLAATLGLSTAASPVAKTAVVPPQSEIHDRQILVEVDVSRGLKAVSSVCASHNVKQVRSVPLSYTTYQIVRVPAGRDYYATLAALQADPAVKSAGPNVIKHCSSTILNDPLLLNGASSIAQGLEYAYAVKDQWGLLATGAPDAWDTTTGDPSVIIALLDTGINFAQEDIVHRYWTNADEIPDNQIDDDNNHFIDDVRGWDFENWVPESGGGDKDPTDDQSGNQSHGMSTASIIAAEGNNGLGMAGVAGGQSLATGIRLMVLRVGIESSISLDAEIGAIDYAVKNGARVISMSFGGVSGGKQESDAIENAWLAGVLCIAAAGNHPGNGNDRPDPDNPLGSTIPLVDLPAGFTHCMAIGATTIFGSGAIIPEELASYSKYIVDQHNDPTTLQPMHGVDVCAPGTNITGAMFNTGYYGSGNYFSGTSAATPIVAGLAGLLLSKNPSLTVGAVRDAIIQGALDLGPAGVDEKYGHGRIRMPAALALVAGGKIGDTNVDKAVNDLDLGPIIANFGARRGEANYDANADANSDGVIDELDVFVVGRHYGD